MPTMPTPPESLPKYLAEGLQKQDSATLKDVAEYAQQLRMFHDTQAESKRTATAATHDVDSVTADDLAAKARDADIPEDAADWDEIFEQGVPGRATLTTKTINDNQYYYFQWREGDQVKSQHVGPVSPKR